MPSRDMSRYAHHDIMYPSAVPFVLVHISCLAAIWTGVTWQSLAICVALYWLRMFAIGAGYHRYFSHRSYATSRVFQFLLAVLAQTTAQKSVLWWAAKHRHHHLHSDTAEDVHSPVHSGFLYSHVGWIFTKRHDMADLTRVSDLTRFRELMWLDKYELVPAVALGLACFLVAGWAGLVVGFLWSTVLVYHATFCINSLAHVHGGRRYVTGDDSRNNFLLALFTMGEGWHNNHHAYQSSVRQGFLWWELDSTYYILRALSWIGVVWDLKTPPAVVLRNEQRLGSKVIERSASRLVARFDAERIATALKSSMPSADLAALCERVTAARSGASEALAGIHLPHVPTREEMLNYARAKLASSPSLEDIADRAYELLLAAVGAHLMARGR
jgi:stearoyl-CoA desaturase (Delta-9 desaturase)